jgi:Stigma-specific protein, Stig1
MNLPRYTAGHALYQTKNVYRESHTSAAIDFAQMEETDESVQSMVVQPAGCIITPKGQVICTGLGTYTCPNGEPFNGPTNCGSCGNTCVAGSDCCNGTCCGGNAGGCSNEFGLGCGCCNSTDTDGVSTPTCVSIIGFDQGTPILDGLPSDRANCGTCGNICGPFANYACCNGVCCAAGQDCCNGVCTDTGSNPNCGGCGVTCNCCTYQGVGQCCDEDQSCCNGFCYPTSDFSSDVYNCGGCNIVCPSGASCCNGVCTTLTTNADCGKCGNECKNGKNCVKGSCLCQDGQSSLNTNSNCGTCGNRCETPNTCCNGVCVNLSSSSNNCGKCGNECQNTCFDSCCVNQPPALNSNNVGNTNYWLSTKGGCQNIVDLAVFFKISSQQNLSAPNGFSLQLNGIPPNNSQGIDYMQYVFAVDFANFLGNSAYANVEYWGGKGPGQKACMVFSNQDVSLPCCSNGDCCSGWDSFWDPIFGGQCQTEMPNFSTVGGTLPAGVQVAIVLLTNQSNGNITGALFEVWDEDGSLISDFTVPIPGYLQVPIQGFQFVAVGFNSGENTQFVSGEGTITYTVAANQELCVDGGSPSCPANPVYSGATTETSNATYGTMNGCCGNVLRQSFST